MSTQTGSEMAHYKLLIDSRDAELHTCVRLEQRCKFANVVLLVIIYTVFNLMQ